MSHVEVAELPEVMSTIKRTGEYRIKGFGRSAVAFVLPLAFGGSVGPEAGLTGIIAAAVCWIGRNLRKAGLRIQDSAGAAASAVLSAVFITPLMGVVMAVRDVLPQAAQSQTPTAVATPAQPNPTAYDFRRWPKLLLYTCAAFGAVGGMTCVTFLFGSEAGIPHFEGATPDLTDLPWMVPCVALGYLAALIYCTSTFVFSKLATALGNRPIIKPMLGGLVLGALAIAVPFVLFPGESQSYVLMDRWSIMGAATLVALGLLKCVATPWCLSMGWKGGHFFPIIFAGIACGYGVAALSGAEPILCVCATTGTLVACIQRSPIIALGLLLLCFPLTNILCLCVACVVGALLPLPETLISTRTSDRDTIDTCSQQIKTQ